MIKTKIKMLLGLLITLLVFGISILVGRDWNLSEFIPSSFGTHLLMLLLSILLIWLLRRQVNYHIEMPALKQVLKPVAIGFLGAVVINIVIGVATTIVTGKPEQHPAMANSSFLQFLLFTFILASVAEEFLFRGFLQNFLKPLQDKKLTLLRWQISLPVFISAFAFSGAHLVLLMSGVSVYFLVRILIFTLFLGLVAGYYQEKYNNHAYAIIVHMAGNLLGLITIGLV